MSFASANAFWAVRSGVVPGCSCLCYSCYELKFNLGVKKKKKGRESGREREKMGPMQSVSCPVTNWLERDRVSEGTKRGHKFRVFGTGLDWLDQNCYQLRALIYCWAHVSGCTQGLRRDVTPADTPVAGLCRRTEHIYSLLLSLTRRIRWMWWDLSGAGPVAITNQHTGIVFSWWRKNLKQHL